VGAGRAELIGDRGAAAEAEDFFRSRAFYDAEGVTHTLRVEGGGTVARAPVIVREVEGSELRDAISPYGYPGGELEGDGPLDPAAVDWEPTGLVSVFARERLGAGPWIGAARERSTVLVHDPARPRRLRTRLGEQIRSNQREGWRVDTTVAPEAPATDREAFEAAYEQTMRRADAAERYFFARDYFAAILSHPRAWLLVARGPDDDFGAGAIVALSDGILHYYLGGTADAALGASPFKNVVDAMVALADELAVPLNLGGGVRPGDGLEAFKRGFANSEFPFFTHEIVCAPEEYERLSAGRPQSGFFPRYRAV